MTPAELDLQAAREAESIIGNQTQIRALGYEQACSIMSNCYRSIRRIRSGGRSVKIVCLSVLLWNNRQRSLPPELDPEDLLALGFHLAVDPSLLFPEWGIVLAGVLLAGFADQLSDSKDETLAKCWRLVDYVRQSAAGPSAHAAGALIVARDAAFVNGLNDVIHAGRREWPDTSDINSISKEKLDAEVAPLNKILPALWTNHQRKIYRLFLERSESWKTTWSVTLDKGI